SAMLINTYDSHKSASLVNCLDDNGQATRDTTKFDAKPTKSLELVFTLSGDIFDAANTEASDADTRLTAGKKYAATLNPNYKYVSNRGVTLDAAGNIVDYKIVEETNESGTGGVAFDLNSSGAKTSSGSAVTNNTKVQTVTKLESSPAGTTITLDGATYTVLTPASFDSGNNMISGTAALTAAANVKEVEVAEEVADANGFTFDVTTISKKAFSKCKKATYIYMPSTISTIEANAFVGAKKLKTIELDTTALTAKTVAKNAFKFNFTGKKLSIKVPKKKKALYTKIIKAKGAKKLMMKKAKKKVVVGVL
nr:leucine-rich repeat domain-containing protein [Lachnospiraceae bacterium]